MSILRLASLKQLLVRPATNRSNRQAIDSARESLGHKATSLSEANDDLLTKILKGETSNNLVIDGRFIAVSIYQGTFGDLFAARPFGSLERVAIKTAACADFAHLIPLEAAGLSRISHPNVVRFFGLFGGGNPYLLLEYIRGCTLGELLKGTRLSRPEINLIISQVLAGLEAIHRSGITHNDLNPFNVMIDRVGGVKLIDFGICSTRFKSANDQTRKIKTDLYMAARIFLQMVENGSATPALKIIKPLANAKEPDQHGYASAMELLRAISHYW